MRSWLTDFKRRLRYHLQETNCGGVAELDYVLPAIQSWLRLNRSGAPGANGPAAGSASPAVYNSQIKPTTPESLKPVAPVLLNCVLYRKVLYRKNESADHYSRHGAHHPPRIGRARRSGPQSVGEPPRNQATDPFDLHIQLASQKVIPFARAIVATFARRWPFGVRRQSRRFRAAEPADRKRKTLSAPHALASVATWSCHSTPRADLPAHRTLHLNAGSYQPNASTERVDRLPVEIGTLLRRIPAVSCVGNILASV